MHIPYLAQLAYGWTSLAFYQNLISVIILVPLMVLFTQSYQGIGAAYVWVILNAWLRADRYPDYASTDSPGREVGLVHLRRWVTDSCSTPNGLGLPSDHAAAAFNPKPNCLHIDCGRIQLFDSSFSRAVPREKLLEAGWIMLRHLSNRTN